MANNRLFIYDPESNTAVCIAKMYSSWSSGEPYIDSWFDENLEFEPVRSTRYQLKTESDLPPDVVVTWSNGNKTKFS